MSENVVVLKQDVQVEPLCGQWYAWPHLLSPATAARHVRRPRRERGVVPFVFHRGAAAALCAVHRSRVRWRYLGRACILIETAGPDALDRSGVELHVRIRDLALHVR